MNSLRQATLLLTGTLALVAAAYAQSTPATNRPNPPAPPPENAPGVPAAPGPASAADAPATVRETPMTPLRELNFGEADVDRDRRLSLTEYSTFVESRMASRSTEAVREETVQRFLDLDRDNDAYLSEAEATAGPQAPQSAVPPRGN